MKIRLVILLALVIILGAVLSSDKSDKTVSDNDGNKETPAPTQRKVAPSPTFQKANVYFESDFIYPGSMITSSGGSIFTMTSSDGSDKITVWYTDKLGNYSVKSFVRTKNNGNVINKLSASNGGQKIEVEIAQSADSNTTYIKVKIE